jgi:N-acetylated-alpha-linked acidic dipeptidase
VSPAEKPLLGFSDKQAAGQLGLEKQFDAFLKTENLRNWMQQLAARPHHVGSPHGKENAEFIAGLFRSWGYQTEIEEFRVLYPTPKSRLLEMTAPTVYRAELSEPTLGEDRTSGQHDEQLPTYNAYSRDGDVIGELVYANHGLPKDYEELDLRGVSVRGKIVITRYGGSWRGIKPKVAAEHGAIGCIIYSDPEEDGYAQGDVYPKGGWRSEASVQRGSVMDFSEHEGDPLTPMIAATANAQRIPREQSNSITKIPVLPISYKDALPLLRALEGPIAPETWRGALPIPHHIGPGPAQVHLKVEFNWDLAPLYDVIARMPGWAHPDEWIIRGNHHDAWVNGATDPISALVALLEEARSVAELAKTGWKPKRTLIYAAWDGEEAGLLGSTEWVEAHRDELQQKAVMYVNSDSNARGFFFAAGSGTLEKFVSQVARDVQDPEKQISVGERARSFQIMTGDPKNLKEVRQREDLRLPPLGSGSDYSPFLQYAGIASLDIGYGAEEEYGQYHSIYDSIDHYLRFVDPSFEYGVLLAKTGGRLMLRMADAEVLPFDFTRFADNVSQYLQQAQDLENQMREETEEKNRRVEEKTFANYFDPTKVFVVPPKMDPVPHLNFAPMQNAVEKLVKSAAGYQNEWGELLSGGTPPAPEKVQELNALLMHAELALTRNEGLPGRPWFRHQVYAPGVYTGYAPKALPSVTESIELRKWKLAEEQIVVVSESLRKFTEVIEKARAILTTAPPKQ